MALGTPAFTTDQSYPFETLRLLMGAQASPGVVLPRDMLVTPASGLQVSVAAGRSFVAETVATEGSFYTTGGLYFNYNDAPSAPYNNILAPSVSPRVDQVILRVYDVVEQVISGSSFARFEWLQGTETSGANVTPGSGGYLAGASPLPPNSLGLAYVLQTVGESSISSGNILNVAPLALSSAAVAVKRLLLTATSSVLGGQSYSTGGATFLLVPATGIVASGAGFSTAYQPPSWGGDAAQPQDFQVSGKTAYGCVRAVINVNATTPAVNLAFGLYPLVALGGGTGQIIYTLGTVVTGSSCGVNNPVANTTYQVESGQFALPSNALTYMLGINMSGGSGTLAANSAMNFTAQLYGYNA